MHRSKRGALSVASANSGMPQPFFPRLWGGGRALHEKLVCVSFGERLIEIAAVGWY